MDRRSLVLGAACASCMPALGRAQGRQTLSRLLFLHGPVTIIIWADPHPHLEMLHRPQARNALRSWERLVLRDPKSGNIAELLSGAVVPPADDGARWRVELPSLARLSVADVPRPKIGDTLDVLGSWTTPVTGTPTIDAQLFLFGGKAYPLPPVGSRA